MVTRADLAPFGVAGFGAVLFAIGVFDVVTGPVGAAVTAAGVAVVLAGAVWHDLLDGRPIGDVSRRDLAIGVLALVGFADTSRSRPTSSCRGRFGSGSASSRQPPCP